MAKRTTENDNGNALMRDEHLYTLEVFIISGPMTQKLSEQNSVISRTIQIRGHQTLNDLHSAIFDAFDREDEHMYEFQLGEGPNDPKGKRYVLPMALKNPFGDVEPSGDTIQTTVDSLGLKIDQAFGYWFDFGDDWWLQINVIDIKHGAPRGKYPKVTNRIGESPPQYLDEDEADDF